MQSVQVAVAVMKLSSEIGLEPGLWIRDSWQNLQTHFQKHKMNVVRVFAPFSQQSSLPNF